MKKILISLFIVSLFVFLVGCTTNTPICKIALKCNPGENLTYYYNESYQCVYPKCVPLKQECTTDSDCAATGCSGILCQAKNSQESPFTSCVYLPEYDCYKNVTCGCSAGKCDWKDKDKLNNCIAEKTNQIQGQTVILKVGDLFDVTLSSNPTTGYSWNAVEIDNSTIELVNTTFVQNQACVKGMTGCGGFETLTFEAKGVGQTTLKLAYCHPWECDKTTEDEKTYSITIVNEYKCPDVKTINCMPVVPPDMEKYCSGTYAEWIKDHCNIEITY